MVSLSNHQDLVLRQAQDEVLMVSLSNHQDLVPRQASAFAEAKLRLRAGRQDEVLMVSLSNHEGRRP
jgi:hypothetical protein